jgi:hypothetical protein
MSDLLHPRCPQCGYRNRALMGSLMRCPRCSVVLLLDTKLNTSARPAYRLAGDGKSWMKLH